MGSQRCLVDGSRRVNLRTCDQGCCNPYIDLRLGAVRDSMPLMRGVTILLDEVRWWDKLFCYVDPMI